MAKRRMLSQELIYDEDFNKLTPEAQNLFLRMICVSDDYGIIPSNLYTLNTLTNPPHKIEKNLDKYLKEIIDKNLGNIFIYENKEYFSFKRESFDRINSYVLAKRTKSEYLRLDKKTMESEKFLEILRNSSNSLSTSIESREYKDISKEYKEGGGVEGDIQKLWISTWGKNPTVPEQNETQKLLDKFGYEKVYNIMYQAKLDGFYKIRTLINRLDNEGNIKPKEEYGTDKRKAPRGSIDINKYAEERAASKPKDA